MFEINSPQDWLKAALLTQLRNRKEKAANEAAEQEKQQQSRQKWNDFLKANFNPKPVDPEAEKENLRKAEEVKHQEDFQKMQKGMSSTLDNLNDQIPELKNFINDINSFKQTLSEKALKAADPIKRAEYSHLANALNPEPFKQKLQRARNPFGNFKQGSLNNLNFQENDMLENLKKHYYRYLGAKPENLQGYGYQALINSLKKIYGENAGLPHDYRDF